VLRPGGWLLCGSDETPGEDGSSADASLPAPLRVRRKWWEMRRELGLGRSAGRSNARGQEELLSEYLRSTGARVERVELAAFTLPPISAREMAERIKARVFSSDWDTAEATHADLSARLDEWLAQAIDAPDAPEAIAGTFTVLAATWPEDRH
jgi:hypothetical protein